jgi:lipoate-protein ligase A
VHEADWQAASAALGQASAHLWTAPVGIVVPKRCAALPGWPALDGRHGEVQVRASGGGVVPQGPGVWNLSLAWPAPSAIPTATEAVYRGLCATLAAALARLGATASPQAVDGSFCDGRHNLAVQGRKLVGTAQAWRRVDGVPMVLAHAVIVVDANPGELTARANAFEAALGTATRYRTEALTSVRLASGQTDIEARTLAALAEQFARVVPAREDHPQEIEHGAA